MTILQKLKDLQKKYVDSIITGTYKLQLMDERGAVILIENIFSQQLAFFEAIKAINSGQEFKPTGIITPEGEYITGEMFNRVLRDYWEVLKSGTA